MIDLTSLETLRDVLAMATGDVDESTRSSVAAVGMDLKAALGCPSVEGDPARDVQVALELCEHSGVRWDHVATANDIQYVQHPANAEPSGFIVLGGPEGAALAICRGLVAQLWLAHPVRAVVRAE